MPFAITGLQSILGQSTACGMNEKSLASDGAGANFFGDLRDRFVTEGREQSRQLIDSLNSGFNPEEARGILHHWVGCGGFLGLPEISDWAAEIQILLRKPDTAVGDRLRQGFEEIARLFSARVPQQGERPKVPERVLSGLAGKRFALVGFVAEEAERMGRTLQQVDAFWRVLARASTPPEPRTLRPFDLVVLDVWSEADGCPGMSAEAIKKSEKAVLVVGSQQRLSEHPWLIREQSLDFLVKPWQVEELLLRAHHLLNGADQKGAGSEERDGQIKHRVLVADDDPTIRAILSRVLENNGMVCHLAQDGGEAKEMIRQLRPDLLVTDIMMPQLDGFELLDMLKNDPETKALPVILLTACQQEADIIRGFGLGAEDYITKPFSPMELVMRVKRLLNKPV